MLLILLPLPALAEDPSPRERTYYFSDGTSYRYQQPSPFGWVGRGFRNLGPAAGDWFAADNLGNLGLLLGTTALLIRYDQQIYDDVSRYGRQHDISQDAVGSGAFEIPHNFGNYMYFIGDGRIPIGIAAGMGASGYLQDDLRMMSTASQLAEVMVSTGIACQGIKMLTGRETPESRSEEGGAWHGPVGPRQYVRDQTRYDAMPSGHLATAVATMTVLAENYHEHETAIYSVGGVLMAMLSFEMVNNGVHWAGDYPLGAAIGYSLGTRVARNNRRRSGPDEAGNIRFDVGAAGDALLLEVRAQF